MADLFRKTSLEKLSSPEQLDKMIVITPPSFWVALAGAALIIGAALLWSVFGRLPVNVETQGIYVNGEGTGTVYAELNGVVQEVMVKNGDALEEGDVIAVLDTTSIQEKLDEYAERIKNVEAVTMLSEQDVVTADNKNLMDIKDQMMTVDQTLQQDMALLVMRQERLAQQRQKTAAAERTMRQAEAAYYAALNTGDSTEAQLAYSEAQSAQANASSYLEAAYGSLDQASVAQTQAQAQYDSARSAYHQATAQREALAGVVKEKEEALAQAVESGDPQTVSANSIAYQNAVDQYNAYVDSNAEAEAKSYMDQYQVELDAARSTKDNYQEDVDQYASRKSNADTDYENAKNAYIQAVGGIGMAQITQTKQSNAYSMALTDYNTEKSTLLSLQDAVDQLTVQTESDRELAQRQTKTIYSQFEATKAAIIDQLQMESRQYEEQLENSTIRSTVSGQVLDVPIIPGSAIQQGSEVLRVQQGEGGEQTQVVVCYVPLNQGKKVTEGMTVFVYPTTVNKQEYGHMEAIVESVDAYVSSTESLRLRLGNDNLVEAFLKDGPVVAVTCRLKEDANTASGYYWSSSKGASLEIAEGTLVEAGIVIEEKQPISMLIPYIKEKLTIRTEE